MCRSSYCPRRTAQINATTNPAADTGASGKMIDHRHGLFPCTLGGRESDTTVIELSGISTAATSGLIGPIMAAAMATTL